MLIRNHDFEQRQEQFEEELESGQFQMERIEGDEQVLPIDQEFEHGPNCAALTGENTCDNDPRKFGGYPSCYMHKITPAGKVTYKSESVYDIIFSQ